MNNTSRKNFQHLGQILSANFSKFAFAQTLFGALAFSVPAFGATITWDGSSLGTSTGTNTSIPAPSTDGTIVASVLSRGSGFTSQSGIAGGLNSSPTGSSTFAAAVTNGDYYRFTVAPSANYLLSFTNVTGTTSRSSTGPTSNQWGYSINGGTTTAAGSSATVTTSQNAFSATLSNTGITTPVEFRAVTFSGATGTYRIYNASLTYTSTLRAATTLTWDGGRGSASWSAYNATASDQSNWNGNNIPLNGDALVFAGTTQTTTSNDVSSLTNVASITFNNTAGAFAVGGNALTVNSGITNSSGSLQTISLPITLGASQTFSAAGGSMTFGAIATAGNTLTIDSTYATNFSGAISGAGSVIKNGNSSTALNVANSFSGTYTANAGQTTLSVDGALGGVSAVNIASGASMLTPTGLTNAINDTAAITVNGNLDLSGGTETIGSLIGTNASALLTIGRSGTSPGGLTVGDSNSTTFAGLIRDGASGTVTSTFTKQGTGSLTLTNANTFTGAVNVNSGALLANNTSGSATGSGTVTVNGGLLSGGGTIAGPSTGTTPVAVSVGTNGTISAGATGGNSIGILTVGNTTSATTIPSLTISGTMLTNLTTPVGTGSIIAGTNNDQISVLGALTLNSTSKLVIVTADDYGMALGQVFYIALNDGADLVTGTFSNQAEGSTVTDNIGDTFTISYIANGDGLVGVAGNDISLTVTGLSATLVPEPTTVLGGILLVGAAGWTQRRRLGGLLGLAV